VGALWNNGTNNGLWIEHTNGGNYILQSRNNNSDSTIDSQVAAANGVFHNLEIRCDNDGLTIEFIVDGVSKGVITTNIYTGGMEFRMSNSVVTTGNGMDIDKIWIAQDA